MKTKTEELLQEIKTRMRSGNILLDELHKHFAPLIAKERVIAKLREYENKDYPKNHTVYYDSCLKSLLALGDDLPSVRCNDPRLYSTYEAWVQVIEEMPETILEAFGWGDV